MTKFAKNILKNSSQCIAVDEINTILLNKALKMQSSIASEQANCILNFTLFISEVGDTETELSQKSTKLGFILEKFLRIGCSTRREVSARREYDG